MTLQSKIFYLFPAFHLGLITLAVLSLLRSPGVAGLVTLLAVIYLLPVGLFRLHDLVWPLREGRTSLVSPEYNPWWGASQLQWTFVAIPTLEVLLRGVPGLFSAWLRLWGSKVGRGVIWTPQLHILDRSMAEIGDHVVFGLQVGLSGHVVSGAGGDLGIVVAKVRIGHGVLLGAGVKLFPGVTIGDKALIGVDSRVCSFARIGARARTGGFCVFDHHAVVEEGAVVEAFSRIERARDA